MYGQGNYAPQFRHGPPTPSPAFQQGPSAHPPPFQQGPPAPPPPVVQQGPLAPQSHVAQLGPPPHVYQHGPPAGPPPVQQGGPPPPPPHLVQKGPPEVPLPGMINTGQAYLHVPPVHGHPPMAPSYPTAQPNLRHLPPPVPPPPPPGAPIVGPSHPEMIRAPLLPRVLPPPPSQGQILFRTPLHLPSPGGMQSLQHVRPPPPPPTSSFVPVTPAPFASFVHAPVEDAHPPFAPPPPPPPPPSSPPPLPPSPPSLASPMLLDSSARSSQITSSMPLDVAADLSHRLESGIGSNKLFDSAKMTTDSVGKLVARVQTTDDVPACDDYRNGEDGTSYEIDSLVEDELSSKPQAFLDRHAPPPKPAEEKVVRKIEVLCEFIAKNGSDFEDMARVKESGNPEFAFLFGGESGSEAAIAHEYFMWMKRKCRLESRLHNRSEQSDSSLKQWEIDPSMQPSSFLDEGASHSPADSDMDMEDDVIQSEKDQVDEHSSESLKREPASICSEVVVVKGQHEPQSSTERLPAKDVFSGGKLLPEHDHSTFERSFSGRHNSAMSSAGAVECSLDSSIQKSTSPLLEDLSPFRASSAAAGISSAEVPGSLIKVGSPFRLIQDYASDDSVEDDDGPCLKDISPARVPPSITADGSHEDMGTDLDVNLRSKSVSVGTEMGFESLAGSAVVCSTSMPIMMPDVSPESLSAVQGTGIVSYTIGKTDELDNSNHRNQTSNDQAAFHEAFQQKDALQADKLDIYPQNGKFQKEGAKKASTPLKVDEFGRLVREGASDSDSDELHYTGRRGKRGRSWSRSRSPQDRRKRSRSPWRRKEKRSRSRSWSPKKRRSRSKSPAAFRRMSEFGGDNMRRDRGQIPDCFDFLRGRCYRGASCRYLHHDSTSDGPRRYRNKQQQYLEVPPDSRNSVAHGEIKNVSAKISVHEHDEVKSHEIQPCTDVSVSSDDAPKDGGLDKKREPGSVGDDVQPIVLNEVSQLLGPISIGMQPIISSEVCQSLVMVTGEMDQSESKVEAVAQVQETQQVQVQEDPTAHPLENENFQQPVETLQLPVDSFPTITATDVETQNSLGETSQDVHSSQANSAIQLSQVNLSVPLSPPDGHHPDQIDSSLLNHSSPVHTSRTSPTHLPMNEPDQNKLSSTQPYSDPTSISQPFPPESFTPQPLAPELHPPTSFPVGSFPFQPSQIPPPPPPPFPQGISAHHVSHPPQDYNLPPAVANFQFQSTPVDRIPPHQAPLHNHHSHFPAPPMPSWTSHPPPPSYVNEMTPGHAIQAPVYQSLQFQKNPMPPTKDFSPQPLMRTYPLEQPIHPQVVGFQPQTYTSAEEPHQPPLQKEDFRQKPLPMGLTLDQPLGGPNFIREERFTHSARIERNQFHPVLQQDYHLHPQQQLREEHRLPLPVRDDVQYIQPFQNQRFSSQFPVQGLTPSGSFAPGNMHTQPVPFQSESPAKQAQSFPGDNLPSTSTGNLFNLQQQQPSYGVQRSAPESFSVHLTATEKVDSTISRYSSSFLDSNQPSRLSIVGGSRISSSTHFNPFASTFDQPPGSSKFSSNVFRQEIGKYNSSFGLGHVPGDGSGISALGSRKMASPPDLSRHFPGSQTQLGRHTTVGDQYDPLFDSIEQSSNTFRKFDHIQEQDPTNNVVNRSIDSDIMLRLRGTHRPLDVEEKNKQKVGADAAVSKSPENDEFGETATDAEVGAVENVSPQPDDDKSWSPSNPIHLANAATGEIEIDQIQTPGKSKKSKDSRSMKLFKIALADFVKEVLKPSWRQGNMSKEAFKTIVKKTVDKVSRAMKGHQIPKSQAKINQYVESSQRKLTKLVMGYVDKYVKV
ncbi:hypothetical protein HHK36_015480 [Tetracentron sinense]|uniref:C3H1-type domain-containing protein n=1 Tax=Tetracentron sinense TaxID=13715 RepID=A0A834Z694_TETSI|nr:hypothetical protein HHK36_015480 [Tetracentron sinense]